MNAAELRIGNWVRTKQTNVEFKIYHTNFDCPPIIKFNYEGIPITEEWLIKFGFKKTISPSMMKLEDIKLMAYGNGNKWGVSAGAYYNSSIYVHQLQNLYFALTGKELELK